eukprot:jgi/Botrbrau1/2855/Bobra.0036s0004.2
MQALQIEYRALGHNVTSLPLSLPTVCHKRRVSLKQLERPNDWRLQTGPARTRLLCRAVLADSTLPKQGGIHKVEEFMTKGNLLTVDPETPLETALEILVRNDITGLPVVDSEGTVVGVVSDFDLLSLDTISGKMQTLGIFPNITTDWGTFHEVQKLLVKNEGRVVGDVMTPDPFVVRETTDFKTAARILLDRKIRRLPVVNAEGKLLGIFSRKDVIKAALQLRNE